MHEEKMEQINAKYENEIKELREINANNAAKIEGGESIAQELTALRVDLEVRISGGFFFGRVFLVSLLCSFLT